MKDDRSRGKNPQVSRRAFLGQASCAAVGTTALFSTVLDLSMINALAGTQPDYRALVCLFLQGGADSFNMLVPRGVSEYSEYAAVRRDLALPRDSLLPIVPATPDGREYGLHPGMAPLQALFEQNRLALLTNIGTLVEPTTLQQYRDRSVRLPLGLFSHSDQVAHWQTSIPDQRSSVGWAGRMGDLLQSLNSNQAISMNISLSGSNILQSGNVTAHYSINQNGSTGLRDYDGSSAAARVRTEAIDGLLGLTYQNLFERTFANTMNGAIRAHVDFGAALEAVPPFQTQFSDTGLSRRFEMIARTIAARQTLGMRRQTFFVGAGGWDHHDDVLNNQANQLPEISNALAEFQSALDEIGVQDEVTTFTCSDFARTLSSNGRGSDHAWGGNVIAMGGAVNGGDLYGNFPDLYEDSPLDTGRGRLIPTTSVDQYFAELALWFGVPRTDLELVLPNVARFYDPLTAAPPLGFLSAASGSSGSSAAARPARVRGGGAGSAGRRSRRVGR